MTPGPDATEAHATGPQDPAPPDTAPPGTARSDTARSDTAPPDPAPPLSGLRVLDLATLFAGPIAAMMLGDFGAEVIKVEHPARPDPARGHGPAKNGVGLWWKLLGRNKRAVTLDLSRPGGRATLLRLAATADVIVENFRPGTLERWELGWPEASRRPTRAWCSPGSPASASSARTRPGPASAPWRRR